ncbi:MAG TPA: tRNA (adenosine(37)-N6)-threonylcarbamoyltransferase complex dimerization subunit type 1 TsaB [Clostridia bacterium]|nr:tRNA (adenosine(37)-N6)-threonylcarbamoyltransferase complex dimerization subunit type 1 TsaB [Clostridia bacterium]
MYVLGLETSSKVLTLGIADEKRVLGELTLNIGLTHGQQLLPAIDVLLNLVGLQPSQLDGIGVTTGPGSFTGLRIGVSTAKAFAQSLEIPICGISTFEALAHNYINTNGLICPLFDARRGEVYTAIYQNDLTELLPPTALSLEELVAKLETLKQRVLFCGDGVELFEQVLLERLPGLAKITPPEIRQVRGGIVAALALKKIKAGRQDDLFSLQPHYLRKSEAELAFLARKTKER